MLWAHQPHPAQRFQYVTSRNRLCYGQSYFCPPWGPRPILIIVLQISLGESPLPLAIPVAGWGWSQTPVPGEVHVITLGSECTPTPALVQGVTTQRIFEGMRYHIPGDIRKRKDSHLCWTVETFTSLEAGSRILTHCHFLLYDLAIVWSGWYRWANASQISFRVSNYLQRKQSWF